MGKIISFANQKGGVGKTTSCVNIAASLGILGKKVLIIDLDPQGNTTSGVGIAKKTLKGGTRELLSGKMAALDIIIETPFENLSVSYVDIEIEIGDSISSLAVEYAEHYPGDFESYVRHIANYNNISNPNEIYIGDHIIIPYYTPKETGGIN